MTRPRPCAGCGVNPVAYAGREFCYDCVPRTWKKPPRCKLCGSTEDYYTNGRCRRCHRSAQLVGSCLDCLAWGVTRHFGWLCEACLGWRRRLSEPRECASCSRIITVNARGYDRLHNGQPLPLNLDTVREAIHSAQPARAALAALVAFHALRSGQLASLKLTDVRDGRLHLDGRVIPLAGPVRERLAAWLDERARRWPATVNPHLFINWYTAVRETPVSSPWISHTLGISPQAVREDRILDEALATRGDIRRLCDLFGLTVGGAERYTRDSSSVPS